MTVRLATADDAVLLGPIEVAAGVRFRTIGMDDIADDAPPTIDEYLDLIAVDRVWVAELDGEVVGYVWLEDLGGHPHLEQISVLPQAGGRGVGVALIGVAVEWASSRGSSITLATFRDVAWNAPWYERQGFVVLGEGELDDALLGVRAHEVATGLDVGARVFMRRPIEPATGLAER